MTTYTYSVKTLHNDDRSAGAFQALLRVDETAYFDLQWQDEEHEQYYLYSSVDPHHFLTNEPLVVTFLDETDYDSEDVAAAAAAAATLGRSRSEAKAEAARTNGRKGGRPKKNFVDRNYPIGKTLSAPNPDADEWVVVEVVNHYTHSGTKTAGIIVRTSDNRHFNIGAEYLAEDGSGLA